MVPPARARPLAVAVALVATTVAYLDTLRFGFVADARFLLADNRYLDGWRWAGPTLTHDYFWSSSTASIPYWRPFTKLSWLVEALLVGRTPFAFHAVQLGFVLVAVAGVYALARRLGASPAWAGAAALLFGLHPALVEPGCLLMARSDVTLVAATLWATVTWHAWITSGDAAPRRRALFAGMHVAAFAMALGSKEPAVVLPLVWTAWALALGGPRRRLATVAPAWLLTIAYLIARARFAPGALPGARVDPLRIFVGVGIYGWGLLPLRVSTGVRNVSWTEARAAATLAIAAVVWLALAAGVVVAWRRRAVSALGLVALALASLLPVLGPMPHVPGAAEKYALAPRWLVTAAAAACVGLALAAERLPLRFRRLAIALVALWAAADLAVARRAHAAYASDATLLALEDDEYEETPPAFRTVEDHCRARDRRLARAVLAADADAALAALAEEAARCPIDDGARFNVASALVRAGRFAEARPLVDAILEHRALAARDVPPALYLAGVVYLHGGEPARAEQLLTAAWRDGLRSCALLGQLADAVAAEGRADEAARRRRDADACRAGAVSRVRADQGGGGQ